MNQNQPTPSKGSGKAWVLQANFAPNNLMTLRKQVTNELDEFFEKAHLLAASIRKCKPSLV